MTDPRGIEKAYEAARQRYAELGVDTDKAMERLSSKAISLHCWQGDDVGGFEKAEEWLSGGGIMATGAYPGRARTCLLYTSPSPRDRTRSRMPSSA